MGLLSGLALHPNVALVTFVSCWQAGGRVAVTLDAILIGSYFKGEVSPTPQERLCTMFHYLSQPVWVLTTLYIIIALLLLFMGAILLVSYLALRRRRRSTEVIPEGGEVQAVGWRKVLTELTDIRTVWATGIVALLMVSLIGTVTGSLLLMSPILITVPLIGILMFLSLKSKEGGLSASEKFDYLWSVTVLLSISIPVGIDAYFVYHPQPSVTYYQDASGGYHESAQRNILAGRVVESRKEDGLVEYQWGEISASGGNVILPNTGNSKDTQRRVEIAEDLPAGEAPYVVRRIDIAKPVGVPESLRLCLAGQDDVKSSSCHANHEEVGKKNVTVVSIIHVPAGERGKYITSSPVDSSVVNKEGKSNNGS